MRAQEIKDLIANTKRAVLDTLTHDSNGRQYRARILMAELPAGAPEIIRVAERSYEYLPELRVDDRRWIATSETIWSVSENLGDYEQVDWSRAVGTLGSFGIKRI